jgi:hypothetical protein
MNIIILLKGDKILCIYIYIYKKKLNDIGVRKDLPSPITRKIRERKIIKA